MIQRRDVPWADKTPEEKADIYVRDLLLPGMRTVERLKEENGGKHTPKSRALLSKYENARPRLIAEYLTDIANGRWL